MKRICNYIAALTLLASTTVCATIVDQSYDAVANGSNGGLNVQADQEIAQTFTAGLSGTLVGVDLQVRTANASPPTGDLLVDIRPTVAGVPVEDNSMALATVPVPPSDVPVFAPIIDDFVRVSFQPFSIFITPGEVLAIVLRYPVGTGNYVWLAQSEVGGPLYPDGVGFARRFSPTWGRLRPETDFGFRTLVPEPTTFALIVIGLAGLGFARGRRVY